MSKRDRKRFKVVWIGETDECGFMTNGKTYTVLSVHNEIHYKFLNNFNAPDFAINTLFKKYRKPRPMKKLTRPNITW